MSSPLQQQRFSAKFVYGHDQPTNRVFVAVITSFKYHGGLCKQRLYLMFMVGPQLAVANGEFSLLQTTRIHNAPQPEFALPTRLREFSMKSLDPDVFLF